MSSLPPFTIPSPPASSSRSPPPGQTNTVRTNGRLGRKPPPPVRLTASRSTGLRDLERIRIGPMVDRPGRPDGKTKVDQNWNGPQHLGGRGTKQGSSSFQFELRPNRPKPRERSRGSLVGSQGGWTILNMFQLAKTRMKSSPRSQIKRKANHGYFQISFLQRGHVVHRRSLPTSKEDSKQCQDLSVQASASSVASSFFFCFVADCQAEACHG